MKKILLLMSTLSLLFFSLTASADFLSDLTGCWKTLQKDGQDVGENPAVTKFNRISSSKSNSLLSQTHDEPLPSTEGWVYFGKDGDWNQFDYLLVLTEQGETSVTEDLLRHHFNGRLKDKKTQLDFSMILDVEIQKVSSDQILWNYRRTYPNKPGLNRQASFLLARKPCP